MDFCLCWHKASKGKAGLSINARFFSVTNEHEEALDRWWKNTRWQNTAVIDGVLCTRDVTVMTLASWKFQNVCSIQFHAKRIFRIFHILRINRIMLLCNLFTGQPSYYAIRVLRISNPRKLFLKLAYVPKLFWYELAVLTRCADCANEFMSVSA